MTQTTDAQEGNPVIIISLWDRLAEWSQETFGSDAERGPQYPLAHLRKEADEAIAEVQHFEWRAVMTTDQVHEEIADCYLLILDAARRAGMTHQDLLNAAACKLVVNMAREWGEPDAEGVIEHVR